MLKWLEINLPQDYSPLYVFRPPEHFDDVIRMIAEKCVRSGWLQHLQHRRAIRRSKKKLVLMLDEAHEFRSDIVEPLDAWGSGGDNAGHGCPARWEEHLRKNSSRSTTASLRRCI